MRRLIINADDFGLTSGINRAILEAHAQGVVTSATLMVNAPAFTEAVTRAQSAPRLGVGCHVVLVDGSPLLGATQIPSLTQSKNGARFQDRLGNFARLAMTGQLDPSEIEHEATAQIRKLQSTGIAVSHLDTHKHTHIFPKVLRPLLRAAQTCGVRAMRNPFEPVRLAQLAGRPSLWKRWIEVKTVQGWAQEFRRAAKEAGITTPDGSLGIVATGALDERLFRLALENLPQGTWEFVCHPGYHDAELVRTGSRLLGSRVQELQILTSGASRELLHRHGIELISYRDLA